MTVCGEQVERRSAGAKVLLVGDWAQLSPVSAGGALHEAVENGHRLSSLGCSPRRCSQRCGVRLAARQAPVRPASCRRVDLVECRRPADPGRRVGGHSVNVLLRVYAKCVYGQDEVARQRIEAALALSGAAVAQEAFSEGDATVTSSRIPHKHR